MHQSRMFVFLFIVGTILLVYGTLDSFLVTSYITAVKNQEALPVFRSSSPSNELYEKIKHEAKKVTRSPIEPRVDPVAKAAIPGYNGREVDMQATLKKTLEKKSNQIQWAYTEMAPKKKLESLGNLPIYQGNEQKKAVSLMINVAWGTEYIDPILQVFHRNNIKTTFFVEGSWLERNPDVARKIHESGHEIGNHAYSHPLMAQITTDRIQQEMKRTEDLLYQTLHLHSTVFAPPAGSFDERTVNVARQFKMKTIRWTVDAIDWRKSSTPEMMLQRVTRKLEPGNLVLMHPTDRTVKALPLIIKFIQRKKWQVTTVSNIISSKRID